MSLLFCDSFSHYTTTELASKWGSVAAALIDPTAGRRGRGALDLSAPYRAVAKTLAPATTHEFCIGAAIKLLRCDVPFNCFGVLHVNGQPQLSVAINRDRSVFVAAGGAVGGGAVGTRLSVDSSILLPADQFYYVELAGVLSTTFGIYNLRINGVTVLQGINQATSPANPDGTWTSVFLTSGSAARLLVCDAYVLDTAGAHNNAPLGDVRVDALMPSGPGLDTGTDYDGWFSPAGSTKNGGAYLALKELAPDITTFMIGSTGHQGAGVAGGGGFPETPTIQVVAVDRAPDTLAGILGVQLNAWLAKSPGDVGDQVKVQFALKNTLPSFGGTVPVLAGVAFQPGTTYAFRQQPLDVNPITGMPFAAEDFQATEFGMARADAQSGPVTTDFTPPFIGPGGAPTITGLSVANAPRCGGAEVTITGTFLPIPFAAQSRYRVYLRVVGNVGTWDVPMKVSPNDPNANTPGHYNSVKVLVPGGKYFNETDLSNFPCTIVAVNSAGANAPFAFALTTETAGLSQLAVETIQPQVAITVPASDVDFLGECAEPSTDIANIALSNIGVNKTIENVLLDPTAEAKAVRLHYARVTNAVLRDYSWPFATRYATLALIDGDGETPINGDWLYSYRAPTDFVAARRIVREGMKRAEDPTPPQFRMGSDADGALLYTDEVDPELEYTGRTTCPAIFGDALFQEALGWRLASKIAPALAKDKATVDGCWKMYQEVLSRARAVGGNESQRDPTQGDAPWIAGR